MQCHVSVITNGGPVDPDEDVESLLQMYCHHIHGRSFLLLARAYAVSIIAEQFQQHCMLEGYVAASLQYCIPCSPMSSQSSHLCNPGVPEHAGNFHRCVASRELLKHHQKCQSTTCSICVPVKQHVQQQRVAAQRKQQEMLMRHRQGGQAPIMENNMQVCLTSSQSHWRFSWLSCFVSVAFSTIWCCASAQQAKHPALQTEQGQRGCMPTPPLCTCCAMTISALQADCCSCYGFVGVMLKGTPLFLARSQIMLPENWQHAHITCS